MADDFILLAGASEPSPVPFAPFSAEALDLLAAISAAARALPRGTLYREEIGAFGFWCRRQHMEEAASRYDDLDARIGRGHIVHIAASNVPMLFAYSMALSLISGCPCSVRASSRRGGADDAFCSMLDQILRRPEHESMQDRASVFTCSRESGELRARLADAAGCVVWGGDASVQAIRGYEMRPDAVRVEFPDRYSVCVIDQGALASLDDESIRALARRAYNDTYAMDQNACSSPCLVIWSGEPDASARERWWEALAREAEGYEMSARMTYVKYEAICRALIAARCRCAARMRTPALCTVEVSSIPPELPDLGARYGCFFEHVGDWRDALRALPARRLQTVTAFGVECREIAAFAARERLSGVHRAVPIGSAMELDTTWDGIDIVRTLSRRIAF